MGTITLTKEMGGVAHMTIADIKTIQRHHPCHRQGSSAQDVVRDHSIIRKAGDI